MSITIITATNNNFLLNIGFDKQLINSVYPHFVRKEKLSEDRIKRLEDIDFV